jgi:hypothetical protein
VSIPRKTDARKSPPPNTLEGMIRSIVADAVRDAMADLRAPAAPRLYDQRRNPFNPDGTDSRAARRYREFVGRHRGELRPVYDGKLCICDADRFDAVLAAQTARPRAVASESAEREPTNSELLSRGRLRAVGGGR